VPKLKTLVSNPATVWHRICVPAWYGHKQNKELEITSDIAIWYRPGNTPATIRWVLVRDPEDRNKGKSLKPTACSRTVAAIWRQLDKKSAT
jgi:hypothetical protein